MSRARILADFGGVTSSATELNLLDGQTDLASQAELDAAAYDDTAVRQDLTILALREAVTENRVAYTNTDSFIDNFQDDSGIGTETDTNWNASEYVQIGINDPNYSNVWVLHQESAGSTTQGHQTGGSGGSGSASQQASVFDSGVEFTTAANKWGTNGIDFTSGRANAAAIEHDATGFPNFKDVANLWTMEAWVYHTSRNASKAIPTYDDTALWAISDTYASINIGDAGRIRTYQYSTGGAVYNDFDASYVLPLNTWTFLAFVWDANYISMWAAGVYIGRCDRLALDSSTPAECRWGCSQNSTSAARYIGYMDDIRLTAAARYSGTSSISVPSGTFETGVAPAGTMIGNANSISPATQTKVSGVMLWKEGGSGTSTIGTHLKIYFTCIAGDSDWNEASYTAVTPVFSTGIKMVKLGETSCDSGSDVRYKAVWASQSVGVIETQLHGIGLNY